MDWFKIVMELVGGLALFLYGMKIMSEALQVSAGDKFKNALGKITNNRFKGVITGFTITGIVQSSSATTVMLVSFVNAGLINLTQSVGIVLGANIGTTITAWIVALLGFKFKIKAFALLAIGIGFFLRFLKKDIIKSYGEILLGFGMLFHGLATMNGATKFLAKSDEIKEIMGSFHADTILTTIVVILIGAVATMIIQSSSATMAITIILASQGLINFPTAVALILGENIGTTITANLAAIGSNLTAKRTALVHMLFNVLGVFWAVAILQILFIPFIDWLVPGDPNSPTEIGSHMAAFHTTFNIVNTLLFLPFVDLLAKTAKKLAPGKDGIDRESHLQYISTSLMSTPSVNINQAKLEIKRMTNITAKMFEDVMTIFNTPNLKIDDSIVQKIHVMEDKTDILEKEISEFLVNIYQHKITAKQSLEISSMLHMVNEIERVADHCENLVRLIKRKYDNKSEFSDEATTQIILISSKVTDFLNIIQENITATSVNIIDEASPIENKINSLKKEMRKEHIKRLNNGDCNVNSGLIFIDMLTSFEKIGDHSFNIAEGISGLRVF